MTTTPTGPTQAQYDAAVAAVNDGLTRQAARSPHDAAIAALGRHATDAQITDWLREWRPGALLDNTA